MFFFLSLFPSYSIFYRFFFRSPYQNVSLDKKQKTFSLLVLFSILWKFIDFITQKNIFCSVSEMVICKLQFSLKISLAEKRKKEETAVIVIKSLSTSLQIFHYEIFFFFFPIPLIYGLCSVMIIWSLRFLYRWNVEGLNCCIYPTTCEKKTR